MTANFQHIGRSAECLVSSFLHAAELEIFHPSLDRNQTDILVHLRESIWLRLQVKHENESKNKKRTMEKIWTSPIQFDWLLYVRYASSEIFVFPKEILKNTPIVLEKIDKTPRVDSGLFKLKFDKFSTGFEKIINNKTNLINAFKALRGT